MVTINKEEGRQGETRNEVRWILLISTALAVLVLFAFLFFNAGGDDSAQQDAVPAQSEMTESAIDRA